MELTIVWTVSAKTSLLIIKNYLLSNFTIKEFERLKKLIDQQIETLKQGRVKHKYIERTNCYKAVLHKHTSLYYKITGNTLYIMAVWDNRRMKGKEKYE